MKNLKAFFDVIALPTKVYLVAVLVTGFLLLTSNEFLARLGVLSFVDDNRAWIGTALVVSAGLLVASALIGGFEVLTDIAAGWFVRWHKKGLIADLSNEEKEILLAYILGETKTLSLPGLGGVVNGLVNKGFIYPATRTALSRGLVEPRFDYNMYDWVYKYLSKRPGLLNK